MSESKVMKRLNINVPEDLYSEYKIALLKLRRGNTTQDILRHLRETIREAEEKEKGEQK